MIRIVDLHKAFGPNKVLRGVNLTVAKGETMVVIGQSGSGKSVLLKLMIGLLKPDAGKIFIDGEETTRLKDEALQGTTRKFGLLFQGAAGGRECAFRAGTPYSILGCRDERAGGRQLGPGWPFRR
jgi:phospholipid/cholesterol/gamma-HCH transport system ATP-binding protein